MNTPDTDPVVDDSAPDVATAELHAKVASTPLWLFNAVKAFHHWPIGKVMSRDDYDAAVKTVTEHRFS